MATLKKCALCSEEYDFCSSCPDKMNLPMWKNSFCSENCKRIYDICVKYHIKEMSREDAKAALAECDLSKKKEFSGTTRRILNEIFAQPKASKKKAAAEEAK